jgi:hypothetical protein
MWPVVTDLEFTQGGSLPGSDFGTTLRIPSPWTRLFVFSRPDEPFTSAESARANRLAQIAEAAVITQGLAVTPPAGGSGTNAVTVCHGRCGRSSQAYRRE